MKISIVEVPAGQISEESFKLAYIEDASDIMYEMAAWSACGLSFWGDTIAADFHIKVPDEVIKGFLERLA